MNNSSPYTIIHFDYGGHYSKNGDDIRWVSREDQIYTLVMKTSIDKATYLGLVDRLSKKIAIDEATTKLKISYIPLVVDPKRPSYILDDDEVFGYLMEVNKDQCRSVLHVELIEDVEQSQLCEQQLSREDRTRDVGVSNEELISNGRVNGGIITPNAGEHYENASCEEELANMDNFGMYEEALPDVEDDQYLNVAWEDGIDITLGQEFESKQAVQDLVEKASHLNSFDFATIKSESKLYVLKCCEEKNGCKWYLRVAKLKNSDCFSVRTHNKIHTCARATTTGTSRKRRKGTPRLVASVLREGYEGQFDTPPTPKDLIGLVERKFGVKVSYSTALRGKKQVANDVRGSNNSMDHTAQ